ncbi:MAG TPA: ABC transporter permease [Bryobacteraceae bacterium]|nr:ABC transporter permease [Bryobacteraceae bacterium]
MFRTWVSRIKGLFLRDRVHDEIEAEREFHIAMRAEEMQRGGMDQRAAERAARRSFGPELSWHEIGFDVRGGGILDDVCNDLRLALRVLKKTPWRTAALILTLVLAIGINVAVFSVLKEVILDPLPFRDPSQLVVLHQVSEGHSEGVSYPNFEDFRAGNNSFEALAVFALDQATLTKPGGVARRVSGAVVSANLFKVLDVKPIRGSLFTEAEDAPHSEKTSLISDRLWRSEYGGREDIVGRSLILDGVGYRILGVVDAKLAFPVQKDPVDYWVTVAGDAEPSPWGGSIRSSRGYPRYDAALGRLKPGVSVSRAQAQMNVIAAAIEKRHPHANLREGVRVSLAIDDIVGGIRPFFWTLYAAVFCVLAVGCANVATLLMAQAAARNREFSLRVALGARPLRLARQLLVESQAIAWLGGLGGVAAAWMLASLLVKLAPADTPRIHEVRIDGWMLLYTLAISVLTGLLFGLAPALHAARQDFGEALSGGMRVLGNRKRAHFFRPSALLISAQVAFTLMLGCSAALLIGSFWRVLHVPRGFAAKDVLTASLALPSASYPENSPRVSRYYQDLLAEVRRVPGVTAASAAQSLPLSGANNSTRFELPGGASGNNDSTDLRFVDPDYFHTLEIPLLEGRIFSSRDSAGRTPVVMINRAFARRFLGGRDPLGTVIRLGWGGEAPKTIVGVVGDVLHGALSSEAQPETYVPIAQFSVSNMALVIRMAPGAQGVEQMLMETIRRRDPAVPADKVRTLEDYLLISAAPQRFLMWIFAVLAIGALLLAALGLFGVLSYSTNLRRREFGIRLALGSSASEIAGMVLKEGLALSALGITVGLALTVVTSRLLQSWLYQTSPLDPRGIGTAICVLLLATVLACWLPVKRAITVDPSMSLREE